MPNLFLISISEIPSRCIICNDDVRLALIDIKHFPKEYLASFGLAAKTADDFITDTIDLNTDLALEAFRALVLNRTNPNLDEFEILDRFRKNGLFHAANYLHSLI